MGQPVAVVEKPGISPGIVRFETNRSLTGMGHMRFTAVEQTGSSTPAAALAKRLFESGRVDAVHVFGNMVTVDLRKGFTSEGLQGIVESLYTYYRPGFVPPAVVMPAEPAATAAAVGGAGTPAGVDSRVPAHLLERSSAARARWAAKAAG